MTDETDYLPYLTGLVPADRLMDVLSMDDEDPALEAYQQAVWQAHGVLRSLHIRREIRSILPMVNAAGERGWAHVLDVGCGAGIKGRILMENGAAAVTGIDNDLDEIEMAQRLPNPWGESLRIVQADVLQPLPFPDAAFDFVLVADGHIDFYDPPVLDELRRVGKPGGMIFFLTTNLLPAVRYAHDRVFASRIEAARWASLDGTDYADRAAQGESYESRFLRACHYLGLNVVHIPAERRNPVPAVFELLIQQTFACFDGRILRQQLSDEDWLRLRELHDPASRAYLFRRDDALFVDMITVALGSIQAGC